MREPSDIAVSGSELFVCDFKVKWNIILQGYKLPCKLYGCGGGTVAGEKNYKDVGKKGKKP